MAFGPKHCAACGSIAEIHEHHLVARAHGGIDLPTVWLCLRCHAKTVHRFDLPITHRALTKHGLDRARARGVTLGSPRLRAGDAEMVKVASRVRCRMADDRASDIGPYIDAARRMGAVSLRQIAEWLMAASVPTPKGSSTWSATQVSRTLQRLRPETNGQSRAELARAASARIKRAIGEARADGVTSFVGIARRLTLAGVPTPSGKTTWTVGQVKVLLDRADAQEGQPPSVDVRPP